MERVFGLDLLRSVAVLMVLAAHTRIFLRPLIPSAQGLSIFGFLGVELFFVLSGFLIGGIVLRSFGSRPDRRALTHFWVRRWFRTLPNYYLFLAANVVLLALEGQRPEPFVSYMAFLQNLAWPAPAFFNESWSLAVEEWFYLLFPLLILAASRLGAGKRSAVALSLTLLFLVSTLGRVVAVSGGNPSWDDEIRKVVIYRFDALMVGVLAAFWKACHLESWKKSRAAGTLVGSLLAVLVVWSYFALDRNGSTFARTALFTATSLSVFSFLPALDAWQTCRGFAATVIRNISLWSYSLYLCHLPVRQVLVSVFGDPEMPGAGASGARLLGLLVAFVAISTAVSGLVYHFFEKPAMDLRERFAAQ